MNVAGLFAGQSVAQPDAIAMGTPDGTISYRDLFARVRRLAAGFTAAGLREDEIVALQCDGVDFVCASLAVAWAGGASMSLPNGGMDACRDAGATMFATMRGPASASERTFTLAQLASAASQTHPAVQRAPEALWRISFSSGTTGDARTVKLSQASCLAKARVLSQLAPLMGEKTVVAMGCAVEFAVAYWFRELSRGAQVELAPGPEEALDCLARSDVDLLVTSPRNALQMAARLRGERSDIRRRPRCMLVGGAALTPAQRRVLRGELCQNLWGSYGSTETGLIALLSPQLMDAEPECSGRLLPGMQAQALDDNGAALVPGETGRLRFRSPTLASGYAGRTGADRASQDAFRDGWFLSKDVGRVDAQGRVFLASRQDNVVNLGGIKFDPAAAERFIASQDGVQECVLVAAERSGGNAELVAVLVAQEACSTQDIIERCRLELPAHQVPHRVVRVDDFPRNDAGKVLRSSLAQRVRAPA